MAKRIKTIDSGVNPKIKKAFLELKQKPAVKSGYPAGTDAAENHKGFDKPITNIQLAVWHEFGTEKAPERSHIRATYDKQKRDWAKLTRALKSKILEGKMEVSKALAIIGQQQVVDFKKFIRAGQFEPWSDATLEARRSKGNIVAITPLIDTAQMINSITYALTKV